MGMMLVKTPAGVLINFDSLVSDSSEFDVSIFVYLFSDSSSREICSTKHKQEHMPVVASMSILSTQRLQEHWERYVV